MSKLSARLNFLLPMICLVVPFFAAMGHSQTKMSDSTITVPTERMQQVYEEVKTPFKYGISGDPQIVRMGDLWVMFYFGAFWQPGAFDTFACSNDMVHWTKWEGKHLIESSEPWDKQFAHKPWVIKHNGVVYHFYCAVGDQGRVIALATSKDMKKITLKDQKNDN